MLRSRVKLPAAATMAVQCEPDLMMSPSSPTIDLSAFLNDRMTICSPQAAQNQEEETSIDIKSHQHRPDYPFKKSNIKCFDEGPLQDPVSDSVDQIDVIDLVNTYVPTPQVHKSEDLNAEKHPKKEYCCNVKACVDDTSAVDIEPRCPTQVESDWQISNKGPIVPGNADIVKEFARALPSYFETAEKVWDPSASQHGLVISGRGTKVADAHIGTDGIRGVHLFSTAAVFDPRNLVQEEPLGDGQFGSVSSYRNLLDGAKYAVKRVALSKLNPHEAVVLALATSQQHQLGSRCLVQGHAFFLEGLDLCMVMHQAERTLEQYMIEKAGCVEKEVVKKIVEQGLQGIQFLSNNNYVHLDIKPQNIGLTKHNDVKFIDFGSCSNINSENENAGLTPKYAAKEVLYPLIERMCGKRAKPVQQTSKADVSSLGVCIISLLRGRHVWDQVTITPNSMHSYIKALEYIFNNEKDLHQQIPAGTNEQLKDLILRMTCYDFTQRCSAEEGLQHPYFTSQDITVQHFDFANSNIYDQQLWALCKNMQIRPTQDVVNTPPTQKVHKPPVQEVPLDILNLLQLPQPAVTFQQPHVTIQQQPQQLDISMTRAAPATAAASVYSELPVMIQDEVDNDHQMQEAAASITVVTQPVDHVPVPQFDQIMMNGRKRWGPPLEEEEVNLRHTGASHQAVPEFENLLTAANDYTKERQPKKQPRMATYQASQGNGQFEFGVANPGFVDLSFRRNAGGKRMPKKTRALGPYDPLRKGATPQ